MSKFIGSWTNNQDGSQESYFDPWLYLSVNENFPIWGNIIFQPEFGMTLKKSSYGDDDTSNGSGDEASKRQLMFLHLNFLNLFLELIHSLILLVQHSLIKTLEKKHPFQVTT